MPDDKQEKPQQQSKERVTEKQSAPRTRQYITEDGEILKAAGARPSTDPDTKPTTTDQPINKAREYEGGKLSEDAATKSGPSQQRPQRPRKPAQERKSNS